MNRRLFSALLMATLVVPIAATAQTKKEQILKMLQDQGYSSIRISRTFLGRTRIVAESTEYRREIILNQNTDEVLRDYWEEISDDAFGGSRVFRDDDRRKKSKSSSSNDDSETSNSDDDDDDDDDDKEDDRDDDEDKEDDEEDDKDDD